MPKISVKLVFIVLGILLPLAALVAFGVYVFNWFYSDNDGKFGCDGGSSTFRDRSRLSPLP